MMTKNTNFKTICGETQNYVLFKINPLKKYYVSWFYLFKSKYLGDYESMFKTALDQDSGIQLDTSGKTHFRQTNLMQLSLNVQLGIFDKGQVPSCT